MYDVCDKREGPLWNSLETAKKYGVLDIVQEAIETGSHITLSLWKKQIKEPILDKEEWRWTSESNLSTSLQRLAHACQN